MGKSLNGDYISTTMQVLVLVKQISMSLTIIKDCINDNAETTHLSYLVFG